MVAGDDVQSSENAMLFLPSRSAYYYFEAITDSTAASSDALP